MRTVTLRKPSPGQAQRTPASLASASRQVIPLSRVPPSIGMRLRPPRKLKERGCRRYPCKKVHTDRHLNEGWRAVGRFKCNLLKVCDDLSGSRIVYVSMFMSLRGCPCGAYVFWFWFVVVCSAPGRSDLCGAETKRLERNPSNDTPKLLNIFRTSTDSEVCDDFLRPEVAAPHRKIHFRSWCWWKREESHGFKPF